MDEASRPNLGGVSETPRAESIVAHLGGEAFLADIGARDFLYGDTQVSFTLWRDCPKHAHLVTIGIEPHGSFRIAYVGWQMSGPMSAPQSGSATVVFRENLATVLAELTGVDALRRRSLRLN